MEAVAQQDVISDLLGKSFAARTFCEQKDILQHKKPLPRMRVRSGNRIFQEKWYAKKIALGLKNCCCKFLTSISTFKPSRIFVFFTHFILHHASRITHA